MDPIKQLINLKMGFIKLEKEKEYFNSVKKNGLELEFVPNEDQTKELCIEAVLQNGKSYKYVAKRFRSWKLWLVSLNKYFKFLL